MGLCEMSTLSQDTAKQNVVYSKLSLEEGASEAHHDGARETSRRATKVVLGCVVIALAVVVSAVLFRTISSSSSSSSEDEAPADVFYHPCFDDRSLLPEPIDYAEPDPSVLPAFTIHAIHENSTSPQALGWKFIQRHPDFKTMPVWRKRQAMAMSTFNFATRPFHEQDAKEHCPLDECLVTSECAFRENTCNDDGVIARLDFDDSVLGDRLPPEISLFTSLASLEMSENYFTGPLPTEIWELTTLTHLGLSYLHTISGTVPTEIGQLTQLISLSMGSNKLHGSLPSEMGELTGLEYLHLSWSKWTGTLPTELGRLVHLTYLGLNNNLFHGTIPSEIGQLKALSTLSLDNNPKITGTLPTELGLCDNLQWLCASNNPHIQGTIPSQLGQVTNLTSLVLNGDEQLTGTVPVELCKQPHVVKTDQTALECSCDACNQTGDGGGAYHCDHAL